MNALVQVALSRPEWRSKLLFHRLMLPQWLRESKAVEWSCGALNEGQSDELKLVIKQDSSDWENIFRILLIPKCVLADEADITLKMKVGVVLPEPEQKRDPMPCMISDGNRAFGIQLLDPNHDYAKSGPYRALEGESARNLLRSPKVYDTGTVPTNTRNNPDQFELSFKPSESFGSAFCAVDDGHKITALYSDVLELSKGLWFELNRFKSTERYTINYIEITVYEDSKPPNS